MKLKLSALLIGIVVSLQISVSVHSAENLEDKAKKLTVRISTLDKNSPKGNGSGVIVGCQNNTCTVVTAWHVINQSSQYIIETWNGQQYETYPVEYSTVKQFPNLDLAEFKFTTNREFPDVNYASTEEITTQKPTIYFSGYPLPGQAVTTREFLFNRGNVIRFVENQSEGYSIETNINSREGMSGGAILNERGDLIGIIGRAEKASSGLNVSTLGIPIHYYPGYIAKPKTLEELLVAERWKEANEKTWEILQASININPSNKFTISDVKNLPCSQLREINNLWHEYSSGRFGFRTQIDRYSSFVKINQEVFRAYDYNSFGEAVSWRKNGKWLTYDELTFSEDAPRGSLPVWFAYSNDTDELDGYGLPSDAYCLASNSPCSAVAASFMQRLRDCEISLR